MFFSSFSGWLKAANWKSKGSRRAEHSRRARCVPRLEILEDRTVPSTFLVTNLLDGPAATPPSGSLRAAIEAANNHPGADNIAFAAGLHGPITLQSELSITASVTINGPGANQLSVSGISSGPDACRVFDITANSGTVTIAGLTIANGSATSGGGILNEGSATLNVSNCTLTGNEALGATALGIAANGGFGGGIEDNSSGR